MSKLADVARDADRAVVEARARLAFAVREASASGMTQHQIAREIGRSQPEVSRLLRFHGTSRLGRTLRTHRAGVLRIIEASGGRDVRVFGSVADGDDGADSDVDLLFTKGEQLGLMELSRMEVQLRDLLGVDVDLVPDSSIRPGLREKVLARAVPL